MPEDLSEEEPCQQSLDELRRFLWAGPLEAHSWVEAGSEEALLVAELALEAGRTW